MRERLDCAVLLTHCTLDWIEPLLGQHAGGRLYLHGLEPVIEIGSVGDSQALGAAAMALRRYDACLIPVWPGSLPWARMSLSQASTRVQTPVLALTRELTAAALLDLHDLGVADFIRHPFCNQEARMRIERLLDVRRNYGNPGEAANRSPAPSSPAHAYDPHAILNDAAVMDPGAWDLEGYAISAAARCASTSESFQNAKKNVIERFERAYLKAALGRHGGNIAMAARAAKKHRRAFWALMRKHSIEAEPYRERIEAWEKHIGPPVAHVGEGQVFSGLTLHGNSPTAQAKVPTKSAVSGLNL